MRFGIWCLVSFAVTLLACSGAPDMTNTGGGSGSTGGGTASVGGGSGSSTGGGTASTGGGSGTTTGGGTGSTGGGSGSTGGGSSATGGGSSATGGGSGSTGGGSASGGGTAQLLANGASCSGATQCQSGFCADGFCCNVECNGACVSCAQADNATQDGLCAPVSNSVVCRPSSGDCDVEETCSNGVCPADSFLAATSVCRAPSGTCDHEERCTGTSASCPTDARFDAGIVCRASGGVCDRVETCDGIAGVCPSDALLDAGVVCRGDAGVCDAVEYCTGSSVMCPGDSKLPATAICRPAAGPCDVPEMCSGSTDTCAPVDVLLPAGSLACAPYRCTGTSAQCTTSCTTDATCASTNRSICVAGQCETARLVFVTSNQYQANFGGVTAADTICQAHANDAGFSGSFRAWLSQPGSSPSTRFQRDGGIYIRLSDKARVATNWSTLVDGNIGSSIGYTEKLTVPPSGLSRLVWTGTNVGGNHATYMSGTNTDTHCANWTNTTNSQHAVYGQCDVIQNGWTEATFTTGCAAGPMRFYCFEQ